MLAVKTTLAEVDEIPILIFDEVDANVGGETAGQVGRNCAAWAVPTRSSASPICRRWRRRDKVTSRWKNG